MIDRVVGSERDEVKELWYRVRWYSYNLQWDTLEPIAHLSVSAVLRYHRLGGTLPPQTLRNAQNGYTAFVDSLRKALNRHTPGDRRTEGREEGRNEDRTPDEDKREKKRTYLHKDHLPPYWLHQWAKGYQGLLARG